MELCHTITVSILWKMKSFAIWLKVQAVITLQLVVVSCLLTLIHLLLCSSLFYKTYVVLVHFYVYVPYEIWMICGGKYANSSSCQVTGYANTTKWRQIGVMNVYWQSWVILYYCVVVKPWLFIPVLIIIKTTYSTVVFRRETVVSVYSCQWN